MNIQTLINVSALFFLAFMFNNCADVKVEHAWACSVEKDQPHKIWRQKKYGEWRLGWEGNAADPINYGPYTWSDINDVPELGESFEVSGETWFIIDMISASAGNSSATTESCTSACAAYCQAQGGYFNGTVQHPGTSLSHCVCIFN